MNSRGREALLALMGLEVSFIAPRSGMTVASATGSVARHCIAFLALVPLCGCWVGGELPYNVGAGVVVPVDSNLAPGWRAETQIDLPVPIQVFGGGMPLRDGHHVLGNLGVVFPVAIKAWTPKDRYWFDLTATFGGGIGILDSTPNAMGAIGLSLCFAKATGPWRIVTGYDWMPVDINMDGRHIHDAGGLRLIFQWDW